MPYTLRRSVGIVSRVPWVSGSENEKAAYNYSLPQGQIAPAQRQAMSVVRHLKERLRLGQPAAAIRTALPATASADPEPLTNEMQAHGLMALMRSPIHRAQGTAHELPRALYRGPSGLSGLPRHGMLV